MVSASENEDPSSILHHKGTLLFITLAPHCELKTSVASSISAIDGSRVSAMSGGSMLLKVEVLTSKLDAKRKGIESRQKACAFTLIRFREASRP